MSKKKKKDLTEKLNMIFNYFDSIDRKLYGLRLKIVITLSFLLTIILPTLNLISDNNTIDTVYSWTTYISTLFVVIVTIAWLGSFRDDGAWSLDLVISRIKTYYLISIDKVNDIKSKDLNNRLYILSIYLIVGGVGIRWLQLVGMFIRDIIEWILSDHLQTFRSMDQLVLYFSVSSTILGIILFIISIKKNPKLVNFQFIIDRKKEPDKNWDQVKIVDEFVVSLNDNVKIGTLLNRCDNKILYEFIRNLKIWKPREVDYEISYQDKLFRHLVKNMPRVKLETEYPLKAITQTREKADLVINDTILIEMKQHPNHEALQKAKGQVEGYLNAWKANGPVILLLCHADYELSKKLLEQFIADQNRLGKVIFCLVME
jgi:hypothetical protein